MNYEFITTIATILLVGASIAGFIVQAIKAASRSTDARFVAIDGQFQQMEERSDARFQQMEERSDARFQQMEGRLERMEQRFEKFDHRLDRFEERFYEIQKQFTTVQQEFTTVHAGIARLEGLVDGVRVSLVSAGAPQPESATARRSGSAYP